MQLSSLGQFLVVVCLLTATYGGKPRPWCLQGTALCRGIASPTERLGHTLTLLPVGETHTQKMQAVILGGQRSLYASSILPLSSMDIINLDDMTLSTRHANFSLPANATMRPRSGHVTLPYRDAQLLVFAGLTYNRAEAQVAIATNDVLLLDWGYESRFPTWRPLTQRTAVGGARGPSPRQRSAAAIVGDTMWAFGGMDNFSRISTSTWRFDIPTANWTRMQANASGHIVPGDDDGTPGLQRATMTASPSGRFLLLYGGRNHSDFPQKRLWVLDTRKIGPNNTVRWWPVALNFNDTDGMDGNLPGYDCTMAFTHTGGPSSPKELRIAVSGAWKSSLGARTNAWRQFVNVIETATSGLVETYLEQITSGARSDLPFRRTMVFINNPPNVAVLLPDDTNVTATIPTDTAVRKEYDNHMTWYKDLAMVLTPDGGRLFLSGGFDPTKASTKFISVNLRRGIVIDMDSSLRPDYIQSAVNSYVFRHAVHVSVPLSSVVTEEEDTSDLIVYTGLDNVNDDSDPRFNEFRVLDARDHVVKASCSAGNYKAGPNSCKVLPLPRDGTTVNDLPSPRDGAALSPMYQIFHVPFKNATKNTTQVVNLGAYIMLMYGGMSMIGDLMNATDLSNGGGDLSDGEVRVRNALEVCDPAATSSTDVRLDDLARCTYAQLRAAVPQGLCAVDDVVEAADYDYDYNAFGEVASGGEYEEASPPPPQMPEYAPTFAAPPLSSLQPAPAYLSPPPPSYPSSSPARNVPTRRSALGSAGRASGHLNLYQAANSNPMEAAHQPCQGAREAAAAAEGSRPRGACPEQVLSLEDEANIFEEGMEGQDQWLSGPHRTPRRVLRQRRAARRQARRQRRLMAGGAESSQHDGMTAGRGPAVTASVWGSRAAAAAGLPRGHADKPAAIKDSLTVASGGDVPTVFGTAYAVLGHGRAYAKMPLVDHSKGYMQPGTSTPLDVIAGPAIYYDLLYNVNGSLKHSPGERGAAAITALPSTSRTASNADALLFGGLTAINKTAANPAGVPLLTNDVHYLQYIPASTLPPAAAAAAHPPPRFSSCPFPVTAAGTPACKSVAPFPQTGDDHALPTSSSSSTPPPPIDKLADEPGVPVFRDCPLKFVAAGDMPAMGTFQLRVWRSLRRDVARGMGIAFTSLDSSFNLRLEDIGKDVAPGPCCPANNSRWAWPPPTSPATFTAASNANASSTGVFKLPYEVLRVKLISNGNGWTAPEDKMAPLRCNVSRSPLNCPRIELFSVDANRTVVGMGHINHTVWDEPVNETSSHTRMLKLALCVDLAKPPPTSSHRLRDPSEAPSQDVFPFHIPGSPNLLRSHELELAADNAELPPPRHRHAVTFVDTSSLFRQGSYGRQGLLVVYGGTTDPLSVDPHALLGDMWALDIERRKWFRMANGGDSPGARMRHSIKADGTLVYLTGGYVFDFEAMQWVNTNDVYHLDMTLGYGAVWTRIEGDAEVLARNAQPTGLTEGIGVSRGRGHLIAPNNKGIVFMPLSRAASVASYLANVSATPAMSGKSTTPTPAAASSSASGTSGVTGHVAGSIITSITDKLYDGDLLLLPEDRDVMITSNLTISSSVVMHGRIARPPAGSADPASSPSPSPAPSSAPSALSPPTPSPDDDDDDDGSATIGPAGNATHHRRRLRTLRGRHHEGARPSWLRVFHEAEAEHPGGGAAAAPAQGAAADAAGGAPVQRQQQLQRMWEVELEGSHLGLKVVAGSPQLQESWAVRATDAGVRAASLAASDQATATFRRMLQTLTVSAGSSGTPGDIDLAPLLALPRTRVICTSNSTWIIDASPNLVNIEFVNCQLLVLPDGSSPAVLINCVIRDTAGRPAVVVAPGGQLVVKACVFFNNTNSNVTGMPAAFGGNGSAIYVQPRGRIDSVSDSVFKWNGYGPGTAAGGAIYVGGADACISAVTNSLFIANGPLNTSRDATAAFIGGGALALEAADGCSVRISGCLFSHNNAGLGKGGAVYMARPDGDSVTVQNSTFTFNSAKMGGGLYLSNVIASLRLSSLNISFNSGYSRGGGIALEGGMYVTADRLLIANNKALAGMGGGLSQSRQGYLRLSNSTLTGNEALYGGAVGGMQDLDLAVYDTFISGNKAQHAGGVECFLCYKVDMERVTFESNTANSAGALSLMTVEMGGRIAHCTFANNVGMPVPEQPRVSDAACSRDDAGSGGAVCIYLRKYVTIEGGAFINNTAISGGALYLRQRCLPGDDQCGPLVLQGGTVMSGNVATRGGGGVVFQSWHNVTNITCGGAARQLEVSELSQGCSEWSNNTASYGACAATFAYRLKLLEPPSGVLRGYRSNDPINLTVVLLDYHGQRILDGTAEATTSMQISVSNGSLAGSSLTTVAGVGDFSGAMRLMAKPGNYTLLVDAPKLWQHLEPLKVNVTVRPCIMGEVTNMVGDRCFPCGGKTFSLNVNSTVCDPCPTNAECGAPPMSWVTLPRDGYWRSGPYSPSILQCPVPAACSSNSSWSRNETMIAYLVALTNGSLPSYNRTMFLATQCAYGYYGAVCGRCLPGFGKRASGECAKCANRWSNLAYYLLSTLINVASIWFTVWMQLPERATPPRDAPSDDDEYNELDPDERLVTQDEDVYAGINGLPHPGPAPVPALSSQGQGNGQGPDTEGSGGGDEGRGDDSGLKAPVPAESPKNLPGGPLPMPQPPPPPPPAPLPPAPAPPPPELPANPSAESPTRLTPLPPLPGTRSHDAAPPLPFSPPAAGGTATEELGKEVGSPSAAATLEDRPPLLPPLPSYPKASIRLPPVLGATGSVLRPPQPLEPLDVRRRSSGTTASLGAADPRGDQGDATCPLPQPDSRASVQGDQSPSQDGTGAGAGPTRSYSARQGSEASVVSPSQVRSPQKGRLQVHFEGESGKEDAAQQDGKGGGSQPGSAAGSTQLHASSNSGSKEGLRRRAMQRSEDGGGSGADCSEFGGEGDQGSEAARGGLAEEYVEVWELVDEDDSGPYKGGNHTVVIKILMSYLQVTSMVRQMDMVWPSIMGGLLAAAKSASQAVTTIVSIDCTLSVSYLPISFQRTLITISTPFVILLLALVVWCLLFLLLRMRRKVRFDMTFASYLRPRLIITTIAIVFYVYPDVTNAFLALFNCQEMDPDTGPYTTWMEARGNYWSNDLDLECYEMPHLWLALAVGLPGVVLFSIGSPLFSWVWLRNHYDILYTSKEFHVSYGFMYEDYSRTCYFWDSVVMARKLAIICVIVFLQTEGAFLQVLTALGIIIVAMVAQLSIRPYRNRRMNDLERLSLYATMAMLYCALLIISNIPITAKKIIGALLFLFNIVVVVFFVYNVAYEFVLGFIWKIDEHSNADGVLTWEDIWVYVEKFHMGKKYTPALYRCLRGCEVCSRTCLVWLCCPVNGCRALLRRLSPRNIGARSGRNTLRLVRGVSAVRGSLRASRSMGLSMASYRGPIGTGSRAPYDTAPELQRMEAPSRRRQRADVGWVTSSGGYRISVAGSSGGGARGASGGGVGEVARAGSSACAALPVASLAEERPQPPPPAPPPAQPRLETVVSVPGSPLESPPLPGSNPDNETPAATGRATVTATTSPPLLMETLSNGPTHHNSLTATPPPRSRPSSVTRRTAPSHDGPGACDPLPTAPGPPAVPPLSRTSSRSSLLLHSGSVAPAELAGRPPRPNAGGLAWARNSGGSPGDAAAGAGRGGGRPRVSRSVEASPAASPPVPTESAGQQRSTARGETKGRKGAKRQLALGDGEQGGEGPQAAQATPGAPAAASAGAPAPTALATSPDGKPSEAP